MQPLLFHRDGNLRDANVALQHLQWPDVAGAEPRSEDSRQARTGGAGGVRGADWMDATPSDVHCEPDARRQLNDASLATDGVYVMAR